MLYDAASKFWCLFVALKVTEVSGIVCGNVLLF